MPLNTTLLGSIADNVKDLGNDTNAAAAGIQDEFAKKAPEVDWTIVNQLLGNIATYGTNAHAQGQAILDELANPTG